PIASEPTIGTSSRRNPIPPAGYSRAPNRSVNTMNATTTAPTTAPITSVSSRNTCSSRSSRSVVHHFAARLHKPTGIAPDSVGMSLLIVGACTVAGREVLSRSPAFRTLGNDLIRPHFAAWQKELQLQYPLSSLLFFEVPSARLQQVIQRDQSQ